MQMMEKLKQKELQHEDGCLTLLPKKNNKNNQQSVIVELAQVNKKMILQDKLSLCEKNFRVRKSFKILDRGLITNEMELKPYWNDYCKEKSSRLWLPLKTDLQDLEQKYSNFLLKKMVENSWFSVIINFNQKENLQKICWQYLPYSHVECVNLEDINKKSKKIRIYPNKGQKILFDKWFGTSRFVYNLVVDHLKQPNTKANWMELKTDIIKNLPEWSKEIPYQIKSIAIKDACKAISNAKIKYKTTQKFNEVKFKSKKNNIQSCYIPKSAIKENGIYYRLSGILKFTEEIPNEINDSRLIKENGRYFICIPYSTTIKIENQDKRVVALDPGVRTFITFYSENCCGKIGNGDYNKIFKLCLFLDNIISKLSKIKLFYKRSQIKRLINRIRWKIKNLISEIHYKTALFFVKNFDIILLPTFEVSKMISKNLRKINNKSVRNMLSFSHYKFKNILKNKAKEYGKIIYDVNEAYTSKTVSWTGEIIENLGSKTIIKSNNDGIIMDRDINAARGILIRAMGDTPKF